MRNVIDPRLVLLLGEAEAEIEKVWQTSSQLLQVITASDISDMDGSQLISFRDRILKLKWIVALTEPNTRMRLKARSKDLGRDLAEDEMAECLGYRPTVCMQ